MCCAGLKGGKPPWLSVLAAFALVKCEVVLPSPAPCHQSRHLYDDEIQVRHVLEIPGIGGQNGEVSLHSLGGEPEVLDAEVGSASTLMGLGCQDIEDLGGAAGDMGSSGLRRIRRRATGACRVMAWISAALRC